MTIIDQYLDIHISDMVQKRRSFNISFELSEFFWIFMDCKYGWYVCIAAIISCVVLFYYD